MPLVIHRPAFELVCFSTYFDILNCHFCVKWMMYDLFHQRYSYISANCFLLELHISAFNFSDAQNLQSVASTCSLLM